MRVLIAFLAFALAARPCEAWWEAGHHIIALLAYDLMEPARQQEFHRLLKQHPRMNDDFVAPENLTSPEQQERWRVGQVGCWPDVVRSVPRFHRSTWHYQLGSTLTLGNVSGVPRNPGPAPVKATLETQDLHLAQAVEVCRRVLRDPSSPAADKAVAVCWVAHLVGDAHQPCHAGSLYVDAVFPTGDRGGNSIPTKQVKNLHGLWDSLLGDRYSAGDIQRRCATIRADAKHWKAAETAANEKEGLNPLTWLAESAALGRSHVYTPEVLKPVQTAMQNRTRDLEPIRLSEEYLKSAGELARVRAAYAAQRLARILNEDLR